MRYIMNRLLSQTEQYFYTHDWTLTGSWFLERKINVKKYVVQVNYWKVKTEAITCIPFEISQIVCEDMRDGKCAPKRCSSAK